MVKVVVLPVRPEAKTPPASRDKRHSTTNPQPIPGATLSEVIEKTFASGAPGQRLPSERQLAEHFDVGRPLVREALRTLVERGVVEVQVGRGIFVRRVQPADAARPVDNLLRRQSVTPRQLTEARSMLEVEAARLACERATEDELERLGALVTTGQKLTDLLARVRNDVQFHLGVVRAAHNPVIETMFSAILRPTAQMMMRSLGDATVSREGVPYHEHLYLAIRDRDPEAAAAASRGHLLVGKRTYGSDFDVDVDVLANRQLGATTANPTPSLDELFATLAGDA